MRGICEQVFQIAKLVYQCGGRLGADSGDARDIVRCIPGQCLERRILRRLDPQLPADISGIADCGFLSPVAEDVDPIRNQLKEITVLRRDDGIQLFAIFPDVACDPVVRFAVFRFPMANAQCIQRRVYIRQLRKRGVLLRHISIVRPIGLVVFIQFLAGIGAFSVKDCQHMCRLNHTNDLQQRAHKAQRALNGLTLTVDDPGGHAVKHLKKQIAPVHDQQFIHKHSLIFVNFPVCKAAEICYNILLGKKIMPK